MRFQMIARLSFLATSIGVAPSASALGQVLDSVPFLPPEVARADGSMIRPHRLELEETTEFENDSTDLDSYTYVTVDASHGWNERQLIIEWTALTWNGTGFDRNLVGEQGLALRARVTPSGVPFGQLVSSHYYPSRSNVVRVNPDGDLHRFATLETRTTGVHNEIVFPYLLAVMDLWAGRAFVLPAFSPYRAADPLSYRLFVVREATTIVDDLGHTHAGWVVEGSSRPTLEEARDLVENFPPSVARYLVSSEPPYFLGKSWIGWTDGSGRTVTKRWRLTTHEDLEVSASARIDEIMRVRARRAAEQIVPWRGGKSGG